MNENIIIEGGHRLEGELEISGSKNATLPIMVASILCKGTLTLHNIPNISDVIFMIRLLKKLGIKFTLIDTGPDSYAKSIQLDASQISETDALYELVIKMRASIWLLGALLGRFGEARVAVPGGCAIGARPIDMHLSALKQMGADIFLEEGCVNATAKHQQLQGSRIIFRKKSVGATENVILAAVLAKGTTIIDNAAMEPEIGDLSRCLVAMGAKIEGIDTEHIVIEGVQELHSAEYSVIPDRIETGTYAFASLITDGDLLLKNVTMQSFTGILPELNALGANIVPVTPTQIRVNRKDGQRLRPLKVVTETYPGFPTDLQSPITALLSTVSGQSTVRETIYENRYMHIPELRKMGADLDLQDGQIIIQGVDHLKGAEVTATELRSGISLVLAGLVAEGTTIIDNVYYIYRGYERLIEKLSCCGAKIRAGVSA